VEKIWYLVLILRNPSFFSVDRLGVQSEFYEIMPTSASGESPENVVMTARSNFMGFTFTGTDHGVQLAQGGLKEVVQSNTPRDPSPARDTEAMEIDQVIVVPDLRAKITGKPAPPRVELSTKPKPVFASNDVSFKNQARMLLKAKALTAKAVERK
jgi:hypothetical protein